MKFLSEAFPFLKGLFGGGNRTIPPSPERPSPLNPWKGFDSGAPCTSALPALAKDGMRFAIRYFTRAQDWRTVGSAEIKAIHASGLGFIPVYQHRSNYPQYFNTSNAKADAVAAIRNAEGVMLPDDLPIFFAVDTDITPATLADIVLYFTVIHDTLVHSPWDVGAYGDDEVLTALQRQGLIRYKWLANAHGWRRDKAYNGWDIKQLPQRRHSSGLLIDDNIMQNPVPLWLPTK